MTSGIYQITNQLNGRIYVGSAVNFNKRKSQHLSKLKSNKHDNKFLQNDFNKCGQDNFTLELIVECPKEHLIAYEQIWIDHFYDKQINCYNICSVARIPPDLTGRKYSDEHKLKLSLNNWNKKNEMSEETKLKISMAGKTYWDSAPIERRKMSDEQKLKRSNTMKGIKRSDETKLKMSQAKKQMSDETKLKMSQAKKQMSDETKLKISIAKKTYWENKKNIKREV